MSLDASSSCKASLKISAYCTSLQMPVRKSAAQPKKSRPEVNT